VAGNLSLADRPCLASTQPLVSSSTSSCSYHAHSTDQKHQKQSKFLSSFSNVLFIYSKNLDFILCNDEINMLWKMSKKCWMKGGEIKIKYAMVEEGQKMRCGITTSLFSRREHHILGL
jgi:hypothetical protein